MSLPVAPVTQTLAEVEQRIKALEAYRLTLYAQRAELLRPVTVQPQGARAA